MGHPIGHTKSPVFQQAGLDALNIEETFEAWDVPPEALADKVGTFRAEGFLAACVTLPHKQAVIPMVDELSDAAKQIGARSAAAELVAGRQGRPVVSRWRSRCSSPYPSLAVPPTR